MSRGGNFLQLDLKAGFGLQLTGKKHSLGIFASLVWGGIDRRMKRGQKVPNRQCPAKEHHRGSVGDGGHRLLGEWFSLPAGGIAPPHPPTPPPCSQA